MDFNREEAKARARRESLKNDLKQHANKLIQGIEKLEDSHAKRAIWELFQNAIDLAKIESTIRIELTENSIIFSHNGEPFTTNTLSSLIKQVSSKDANTTEDGVGQYGTGFITTHSFGKIISLSGCLKENQGYIHFNDFIIDRSPIEANELIENLVNHQEEVFNLLDKGNLSPIPTNYTSLAYQIVTSGEKESAQNTLKAIPIILPAVMVFNPKLKKVEVIDIHQSVTIYKKGESRMIEDLWETTIYINDSIQKIYSIQSEDKNLEIILPLNSVLETKEVHEELSRLFLYYPLIGTEDFGFNFILHCKDFAPKEQRDSIHLNSKNETVKPKEKSNQNLMQKASELVFSYLEQYITKVKSPINLATIAFKTCSDNSYLNEYFKKFKEFWVNKYMTLSIVETNTPEQQRITPSNAIFLDIDLLHDLEFDDAIYNVASQFFPNLPEQNIIRQWSELTQDWENSDLELLDCEKLVKKIEFTQSLSAIKDKESLKTFYEYLIKYGKSELFNDYAILPNRGLKFYKTAQLRLAPDIDPMLTEVAEVLMPETLELFINDSFKFELELGYYNRKDFAKDINAKIIEVRDNFKKRGELSNSGYIKALLEYCSIFPFDNSTNKRAKLLPILSGYFEHIFDYKCLELKEQNELDWRIAIRFLVRIFFTQVSNSGIDWIQKNLSLLVKVLDIVYDADNFKDLVDSIPMIPNQKFKLKKLSEPFIDDNIPPKLKKYYNQIVTEKPKIESILVDPSFNRFLDGKRIMSPRNVANEIDTVFTEAGEYTDINEHKYSKEILEIIQLISDDEEWGKYFPGINDKKATILMAKIQDEETKKDLFSILSMDKRKIKKLNKLANDPDFDRIVELGKRALDEEQKKDADFKFKKGIGVHIEDLIRNKIDAQLTSFKVDVDERQGGQDILIMLRGSIIYRIEVKSRWSANSSVQMSSTQMKTASNNINNYALCAVSMVGYHPEDDHRYKVPTIELIKNRIKFVPNIGSLLSSLVTEIETGQSAMEGIFLSGDYKATISQEIINAPTSLTFDKFIDYLIDLIE